MSIIDGKLVFAENAVATNASGGIRIGDVIDLASFRTDGALQALSFGEPLWWVNRVDTVDTGGTDFLFCLKTSDVANITTDGDGRILIDSQTFFTSSLKAGDFWVSTVPATSIQLNRYLAVLIKTSHSYSALRVSSYLTVTPPPFGWMAVDARGS